MAGALTISTLKDSSGVLATQNGMTGIAKAWVQFAGSTGTINGSFNVSSITKTGTGDYTANYTTAMPNTNYVWSVGYAFPNAATSNDSTSPGVYQGSNLTTSIRLIFQRQRTNTGTTLDTDYVGSLAIFSS
jgi:hypothetical protein